MATITSTTPADLIEDGRGATFYEAVTTAYELGHDELELLAEVARMLDLLDALREATTAPVITTDRGPIVHPALVEARQVREALRKSLHALGLPDEAGDNVRSRAARHAAQAGRS